MKKIIPALFMLIAVSRLIPADAVGRKAGDVEKVAGIEMVFCPAGSFMMGSDEQAREQPVHTVTLDGFWAGKYEVTQALYQQVMGINPSHFKNKPNNPVETVNWYDAVEFCNALSRQAELTPYYIITKTEKDPNNMNNEDKVKWIVTIQEGSNGFRLPTEAEWEYACRAGEKTKYYWGDTNAPSVIEKYTVYTENSYKKGSTHPDYGTHPVGTKKPNNWGIYDMNGNVWEWCFDWSDSNYYKICPIKNPKGAEKGTFRVLRGGSWDKYFLQMRIAHRDLKLPDNCDYSNGFRVVRSAFK